LAFDLIFRADPGNVSKMGIPYIWVQILCGLDVPHQEKLMQYNFWINEGGSDSIALFKHLNSRILERYQSMLKINAIINNFVAGKQKQFSHLITSFKPVDTSSNQSNFSLEITFNSCRVQVEIVLPSSYPYEPCQFKLNSGNEQLTVAFENVKEEIVNASLSKPEMIQERLLELQLSKFFELLL
jgi:hypothetical protein